MKKLTFSAMCLILTANATPAFAVNGIVKTSANSIAYYDFVRDYYQARQAKCRADRNAGLSPAGFSYPPKPEDAGLTVDRSLYGLTIQEIKPIETKKMHEAISARKEYKKCSG